MGFGSVVQTGFGFLLARHNDLDIPPNNPTPRNTLHTIFHRPRDMPLPLTPLSVLRSLVQLQDLQALLWAWLLVAFFVLIAYLSNPSNHSFRPFLTDFAFRERLRFLHHGSSHDESSSAATPQKHATPRATDKLASSSGRLFKATFSSTSPFAMTFASRLSVSVRTPPYLRRDLRLFSIVTISHSMPLYYAASSSAATSTCRSDPSAKSDGTADYISVFVGAFGKWWVLFYGMPSSQLNRTKSCHPKPPTDQRESLEENRPSLPDWGVLEMHSADSENDFRDWACAKNLETVHAESEYAAAAATANDSSGLAILTNNQPLGMPPVSSENEKPSTESDSDECLVLAASLAQLRNQVVDLQDQLGQARSASAKACENLLTDLEQVRVKKRDEDKARLDIKSRTKLLDENKRQVETTKREAERRLKAANNARSNKQKSISSKREQIQALKKRSTNLSNKVEASAARKVERIQELRSLTQAAQDKLETLEQELNVLHQNVSEAEETVASEKINLQAASDLAHWRETHRLHFHSPPLWNQPTDPNLNFPLPPSETTVNHHPYYFPSHAAIDQAYTAAATSDHLYPNPSLYGGYAPSITQAAVGSGLVPGPNEGHPADPNSPRRMRALGTNMFRNAFRKATGSGGSGGVGGEGDLGNSMVGNPGENPIGSKTVSSDFEAMKQAFQPTIGSDEEGRRSWSAFDLWQSDMRENTRHRIQWANAEEYNGSTDSFTNTVAQRSSTEHDETLDSEQLRNLTKVKRAFRWPFRPNHLQGEVA